jgi:xylan 1,4-beta-xylosidase
MRHCIITGCMVCLIMYSMQTVAQNTKSATYCNPVNIDYGLTPRGRHAADPVIVLFKDKYYLFTTWDIKGYRVSEDLFTWKDILFPEQTWEKVNCAGTITAPAVASDGNTMYFINFNAGRRTERTPVFRTRNPDSGVWEICGSIRTVSDPCLFIDKGRFFVYYGLGASQSTQCFELDPVTFTEIPGSNKILRPALSGLNDYIGGYHRGRRELFDQTDPSGWLGKFKNEPCPEAPWMTKYKDKYYLQYATPGTVSQWYCDIVMEGSTPAGPFRESDYNPESLKVGGFIGSAGHSCVFIDKNSLYWRITTMWVGKHDLFERRLGIFPVTFDKKDRMITHTALGDYPMLRKYSIRKNGVISKPEWYVQSFGKKCLASSYLDSFEVENASDENVRTWWSAKTGNPGEWLSMDLGKKCTVNALQINFAEQETNIGAEDYSDYHAYRIFSSDDGKNWSLLIDKSKNKSCIPHDYIELGKPVLIRYLKIENVHMAKSGKFAVSDMRVFGNGMGRSPEKVSITEVKRDMSDSRNAHISWEQGNIADGYLVRFGIEPDILNQCIQIKGNEKNGLDIHILMKDVFYFFRIDSYNDSGISEGNLYVKS